MKRKDILAGALLLIFFIGCVSFVMAQSAEEMARGQSPGLKYVHRFTDQEDKSHLLSIYIRGDEITLTHTVEGMSKGSSDTVRLVSKRTEGNKLILKDSKNNDYIIDGHWLIHRWTLPDENKVVEQVYTQE
jgi:hypothetical protein